MEVFPHLKEKNKEQKSPLCTRTPQVQSFSIDSYIIFCITRSRSSLLSFSRLSLTRPGPCRPESPTASLNSGSAKSMNDHKQ
uniref:Uncharacterized protein MANES_18G011700 n=1 Tax=Rhizophora mucronata TaxID=61149 RepID=A0A2P2MB50_RHIMU